MPVNIHVIIDAYDIGPYVYIHTHETFRIISARLSTLARSCLFGRFTNPLRWRHSSLGVIALSLSPGDGDEHCQKDRYIEYNQSTYI